MKLTNEMRKTVEHQFDSYCKKNWVVDEEAEDRMRIRLITHILKFNPVPKQKENKDGK